MTWLLLLPSVAVLLIVLLAGWILARGLDRPISDLDLRLSRLDQQLDDEAFARLSLYPPLGRHGLSVPVERYSLGFTEHTVTERER